MARWRWLLLIGQINTYDFAKINRAIADSKRGSTIKPVLLISH
jgi:hypothetical protein